MNIQIIVPILIKRFRPIVSLNFSNPKNNQVISNIPDITYNNCIKKISSLFLAKKIAYIIYAKIAMIKVDTCNIYILLNTLFKDSLLSLTAATLRFP